MAQLNIFQNAEDVRRFNRFYTRQIGLLQERLLHSSFSLTEARIIYELAQRGQTTASVLANEIGLDPGYLSRILHRFQKHGLVNKQASKTDGRQTLLGLTTAGQATFAQINSDSHNEIEAMMSRLTAEEQARLLQAMDTIEGLLGDPPEQKAPYLLRPHQPGDMGWVLSRHGVLYAQEYGWDERFEALVAEIVANFINHYDPRWERCWIAEKDGENVGSVFLVRLSESVAKLRLLLVEPRARGLGIGSRLVQECVRFARQAGYQKITLWTNNVLVGARHIYEKNGFRLVQSEAYHDFGQDLVSETWELDLRSGD